MAARNDIAERKAALLRDLRILHQEQPAASGGTALKQRELSERYGLSIRTVSLALQELVEEGLLYTVPRIGTFLGRPALQTSQPYLIISHHLGLPYGFFDQFQVGFEDRIAQLGGASLTLSEPEALWLHEHGNLPGISGVFEIGVAHVGMGSASKALLASGIAGASFGPLEDMEVLADVVDFDNEDGGAQAATHMLNMGHRKIAFLAVHNEHNKKKFRWSMQRERGWVRAMQQTGRSADGMVFYPSETITRETFEPQIMATKEAAFRLLQQNQATAVVAVNVFAAHGLLQALHESNLPMNRWPAIVCFDSAPRSQVAPSTSVISYLRLPWEKVGTEAAQLLWDRKNGRLTGPPQQRLVQMQLIPRLSCRPQWAWASGLGKSQAPGPVPAAVAQP